MASILITYSTTDGQTLKICRRLQQVIEQQDHPSRATLLPTFRQYMKLSTQSAPTGGSDEGARGRMSALLGGETH